MADVAEMPRESNATPVKKLVKSRKALKNLKPSSSEANIMAASVVSDPPNAATPVVRESAEKENHESFCHKNSKKAASKAKKSSSFEKEFLEMQEMLQKLQIEKEQAEELLKAKEEMLVQREKEQEELEMEIKELQKTMEFKPNLEDKDEEKKKEKKVKKPTTHYAGNEKCEEEEQKSDDTAHAISGEEAKQVQVRRSTRIRKPVHWMMSGNYVYK